MLSLRVSKHKNRNRVWISR